MMYKQENKMQEFMHGFFQDLAQRFPVTKSLIVGVSCGLWSYFHGLNIPALQFINLGWVMFTIGLIKAMIVGGATTIAARMAGYAWDNRKKYFTRAKNKIKKRFKK